MNRILIGSQLVNKLAHSKSLLKNVRFYCNQVKIENVSSSIDENSNEQRSNHNLKGDREAGKGTGWVEKVLYSSYFEQFLGFSSYKKEMRQRSEIKQAFLEEHVRKSNILPPVALKYLLEEDPHNKIVDNEAEPEEETDVQFPFKIANKTKFMEDQAEANFGSDKDQDGGQRELESSEFGSAEGRKEPINFVSVADKFRQERVDLVAALEDSSEDDKSSLEAAVDICLLKAGTPNPSIPPSNVPCGGCGAFLHCQDQSVPGYISSEKFKGARKADLMGEVCYRCSILESHQATLDVNVSPDDYPKIVSKIKETFSMVLLLVDVTDFPCSIWPELLDIIGTKRPIFLVGNKVDMIPQDSPEYLKRLEESLLKTVVDLKMLDGNIVHTALISAKTGYGVENLITSIFSSWKGKGDIFIMGCTNVGKSSLFNLFLKSDLCKPEVSDRVQRATISQWPGTTLNMLKFPMSSPMGLSRYLRHKRLSAEFPVVKAEERERAEHFAHTKDPKYITLSGHVGKTFVSKAKENEMEDEFRLQDMFQINPKASDPPFVKKLGQWNPEFYEFRRANWVYDTPGAVNTNQILDLLTLPELMKSLPKTLIEPRTYFIKPQMTLFVGGLVRIDFNEGDVPIRYTIFANSALPITMCLCSDADEVYDQGLGSKAFAVPSGSPERIAQFPKLGSKSIDLVGTGNNFSCADIVLSSIGWIAVTAGHQRKISLSVYTPDGKGIFIREPALLPYAVNWKGKRIRETYAYKPHKLYEPTKRYRIKRPAPSPLETIIRNKKVQ